MTFNYIKIYFVVYKNHVYLSSKKGRLVREAEQHKKMMINFVDNAFQKPTLEK